MTDTPIHKFTDGPIAKRIMGMCYSIHCQLIRDQSAPDNPTLVAWGDDPNLARASIVEHLAEAMRDLGAFHPRLVVWSRQAMAIAILDNIPEEPAMRRLLAGSIAALLKTTPAQGYLFASEAWIAHYGTDPEIDQVPPRDREDKQEGVLLLTATRTSYRADLLSTIRGDDGAVDLVEHAHDTAGGGSDPLMRNLFLTRPR